MSITLRDMIIGFIAGALAVLIFHQGMVFVLGQLGWTTFPAWSFASVPPYGIPWLINSMFWGGLWGVLFALIADRILFGPYWFKGLIFGLVFTTILGSWIIVALIKGRPIFGGFLNGYDITRLRNGFLINSIAFGIGLGLLYQILTVRKTKD